VSGVFIAVGMLPSTELLKGLVSLDASGYAIAGEDCKTDVPGVFAAGDVRTKHLRQVVTAAADGATAIYGIESYLNEQ
jgi:thioredoxin reductase (NADPH)